MCRSKHKVGDVMAGTYLLNNLPRLLTTAKGGEETQGVLQGGGREGRRGGEKAVAAGRGGEDWVRGSKDVREIETM